MVYNSLIPQPGDLISVSQNDLLNNFTSMQSTFSTDHLGFNPITNLGFHQFVTFAGVAADPVGLTFQSARAYTKSFGTAPNRNTELYYADQRETSPQLISLIPHIKCMGRISFTGALGAQNIITTNTLSINIASASLIFANILEITFTNPLDYDTYFVSNLLSVSQVNAIQVSAQTQTKFSVLLTGILGPGANFGFMVI